MSRPVIFFDVGGVLLSNGWDTAARLAAAARFGFDSDEFEDRHERLSAQFEIGEVDRDTYLRRTLFHRKRDFSAEDVWEFMKSQSSPHLDALAGVRRLREAGHVLATLNNESRALNLHRITTFGLGHLFAAFISSCFVGARKPDRAIYRIAIEVTGADPARSVFVDDREINLECASEFGLDVIHHTRWTTTESALEERFPTPSV